PVGGAGRAQRQSRRPGRGGSGGRARGAQGARRNDHHGRTSPGPHIAARQAGRVEGRDARSIRPFGDGTAADACRRRSIQSARAGAARRSSGGARMKTTLPMSFAGLLAFGDNDPNARAELVRQTRWMLLPLALVVALIVLWSATAPLSGAVVANGQV